MNDIEQKLKKAAELYAREEGETLLAEAEGLRRENVSYLTPRADKTVRGLAAKRRRPSNRNALIGAASAAACILIVIRIISGVPGMSGGGIGSYDAAPEPASEAPQSADSSDDGGAMESPADGGVAESPTDSGAPGESVPPGFPQEILPISFALPAGYHVTSVELDNGMSIYELESSRRGTVVLTMYYGDTYANTKFAGFSEVIIDGRPVPAKVNDAYRLLAFEQDGLMYTLSSEDDLGALAAFYRSIAV